ncbi:hypothetical protein [Hyphomonas sp.]|uniref:hypothetical protein n=1 Tax=Hyphomonas sp. TaxID=87 RepID=UPI00391A034D
MKQALLAIGLTAVLGACVYSSETVRPEPAALAIPAPPAAIVKAPGYTVLTAILPDAASEGLPPAMLDPMTEGVPLRLDLTLRPPLEPSFVQVNGAYISAGTCEFGPVPATGILVPTGSYHMLLDVELGARETHPANLLSCEYNPSALGSDDPPAVWRLRGCFLPLPVSIPTAVVWALNPLPAEACGIGD